MLWGLTLRAVTLSQIRITYYLDGPWLVMDQNVSKNWFLEYTLWRYQVFFFDILLVCIEGNVCIMLIRDMCHFALRPMKSVQPRHKTNIDLIYEYIYPYISKIRSMSQNDQQPHRTTFQKARQTKVKLIWKRVVALTFQIQVAVDTSDSFKFYWFYPLTTTSTTATICKIEQTIIDSSIHQDIPGIMKM